MEIKEREFICLNCGFIKTIETSNSISSINYCNKCSDTPFYGSRQFRLQVGGMVYRPFTYFRDKVRG